MSFKEWFEMSNLTPMAFSRIVGVQRLTVVDILKGKRKPSRRTIGKFVMKTRNMKVPITREMFE